MITDILSFFSHLFDASNWPPRWYCGEWTDFHGWLYILSNLGIWSAYMAIPILMIYFLQKKGEEIPFRNIAWLYIFFILSCGATHFVDAMLFWYPAYRFSAIVLFSTAVVSWFTVFGLIKIAPEAIKLKTPAQLSKIIQQKTQELEASNQRLQKTNEDIDNFIYAASHDLKSPITNIEGIVDILEDEFEDDDKEIKELTTRMKGSLSKVRETISVLTDIAKLQKVPYDDIQKLSFKSVLDEIIKENQILLEDNNVSIIENLQVDDIQYSKKALYSVITNLLSNAVKYQSPERDPNIIISTYKENNKTVFTLEDNGVGIEEAYKERVFKIFDRLHDHVEGSGIGLYMIKRLIEDRGGEISFMSVPGKKTVFKVIF